MLSQEEFDDQAPDLADFLGGGPDRQSGLGRGGTGRQDAAALDLDQA
jgi:hypothetical protein